MSAGSISAGHLVLTVLSLPSRRALAPVQHWVTRAFVVTEILATRYQFGFTERSGVPLVTFTFVRVRALVQHYTFSWGIRGF